MPAFNKAPENNGATFRAQIDDKLLDSVAAEPITANTKEIYKAISQIARERLARRWVNTQVEDRKNKTRRIYYLSMEFLIGRALNNALSALDLRDQAETAFARNGGPSLSEVLECEPDAALGNGGLGRHCRLLPGLDGDAGITVLGVRHAL